MVGFLSRLFGGTLHKLVRTSYKIKATDEFYLFYPNLALFICPLFYKALQDSLKFWVKANPFILYSVLLVKILFFIIHPKLV